MLAEGLQFQKFIALSLLAHLIFVGLLSTAPLSVPFPGERPLRVRIMNQPAPALKRPPLDPRNLGQFSSRAQHPAEKEGPARTPDSSWLPNVESGSPRAAIVPPPPPPQLGPAAPTPRTVPIPAIPPVAPAPSTLADLSKAPPQLGPAAPTPRVVPTPSIPPPLRVPQAPASAPGAAVLAQPRVTTAPQDPAADSGGGSSESRATRPRSAPVAPALEGPAKAGLQGRPAPLSTAPLAGKGAQEGKGIEPHRPAADSGGGSSESRATRPRSAPVAPALEGPAKAGPQARPGIAEPKGSQVARPPGDGPEGPARQYDLRGQVAMLWKNLDPSKYPYQDLDTGEEGDAGSTTERTISLDSQDSRYASYLLGVKRRIEGFWMYPPEARGLTGNLMVTFGITRDGQLMDLQVTDTSGIAPLDNEAVRAIREAAPFAPFPQRMKFERLNIRAAFYYYASRAGLRGR